MKEEEEAGEEARRWRDRRQRTLSEMKKDDEREDGRQ